MSPAADAGGLGLAAVGLLYNAMTRHLQITSNHSLAERPCGDCQHSCNAGPLVSPLLLDWVSFTSMLPEGLRRQGTTQHTGWRQSRGRIVMRPGKFFHVLLGHEIQTCQLIGWLLITCSLPTLDRKYGGLEIAATRCQQLMMAGILVTTTKAESSLPNWQLAYETTAPFSKTHAWPGPGHGPWSGKWVSTKQGNNYQI